MTAPSTTLPPPLPGANPPPPPLVAAEPPRGSASGRTPRARKSPDRLTFSVIAWGVLATAAVGYMGLAASRPDIIQRYSPTAGGSLFAAWSNSVDTTKAEIETLRQSIGSLEGEITTLKARLTDAMEANETLAARLNATETTAGAAAPSAATASGAKGADKPGEVTPAAPGLRLAPAPVASASPQAGEIKVINGGTAAAVAGAKPSTTSSPIETGSLKPAPKPSEIPAFGPPLVKAEPKPLGIVVGSGPTLDTLRLSWALISETGSDKLKTLEPRYQTSVTDAGPVYNLVAGPVKSQAEGRTLCKELAKRGITCKVVNDFQGEGL